MCEQALFGHVGIPNPHGLQYIKHVHLGQFCKNKRNACYNHKRTIYNKWCVINSKMASSTKVTVISELMQILVDKYILILQKENIL